MGEPSGIGGIAKSASNQMLRFFIFIMGPRTPSAGALMAAAGQGSVKVVEKLIEAGADTTITDSRGVSACHMAAEVGGTDVVAALVRGGAALDPERVLEEEADLERADPHLLAEELVAALAAVVDEPLLDSVVLPSFDAIALETIKRDQDDVILKNCIDFLISDWCHYWIERIVRSGFIIGTSICGCEIHCIR